MMNITLKKDYIKIADELRDFDYREEDREQKKCHVFDPTKSTT